MPIEKPDFRANAEAPVLVPGARYPGIVSRGSLGAGLSLAAKKIKAEYRVANITHVPLEPRASVAR